MKQTINPIIEKTEFLTAITEKELDTSRKDSKEKIHFESIENAFSICGNEREI
jgi:hypothetical protein